MGKLIQTARVKYHVFSRASNVPRAKQAGLTSKEIIRILQGPKAEGWAPIERLLLRAVDELLAETFVSDVTWDALAQQFSEPQPMGLVGTVGQYALGTMTRALILSSLR